VHDAVGERADALGVRDQRVGGEAGCADEMREPPRGFRIRCQGVGGAGARAHGLGDAFESHQRRVGVGGERDRGRHHRQDVREHLSETRRRLGQTRQRLVAASRLREAEPLEQLLGRGAVAGGARLGRSCERLQQRPVEQPLVDRTDEPGRPVVLALERRGVFLSERARDRRAGAGVRGQVVCLEVADDLQPVLEPAKEPIRVGERRGVGGRHVPLVGQRAERFQRVRAAKRRISAAVHDLQQLHRELDVADAAAPTLDLGQLLAALADVLLQANLCAPHVVDGRGLQVRRIHERRHAVDEGAAKVEIARRRACLDHRLSFPRGRAALVVRERRVEGSRQGAGTSARP
jgi:hypothetical protein